jgi:hypothetical protein
MNARKGFAFQQAMSRAMVIGQTNPEILDIYDFELIQRDLDRGAGMPTNWTFTPTQLKKNRAAKAQAAQQAMLQETAATAMGNHPLDVAKIASGNIAA